MLALRLAPVVRKDRFTVIVGYNVSWSVEARIRDAFIARYNTFIACECNITM